MFLSNDGGADSSRRRIILCCIQTKEYGVAAEVYNSMPASTKDAALSRYLMFKVAMRTSDDDLGIELSRRCFVDAFADMFSSYLPDGHIFGPRCRPEVLIRLRDRRTELWECEVCAEAATGGSGADGSSARGQAADTFEVHDTADDGRA